MEIRYVDGRFIALCTFDERVLPRDAGFVWDTEIKRWTTDSPYIARKLEEYLTPRARAAAIPVADPSKLIVPEGLNYLPFQSEGIIYALQRKDTLIADEPGLGKGHPVSTLLLTPTGWRALGDLAVGDKVIGSSGRPTSVTRIFDRGRLPVYIVETNDGGSVTCDGEHLWLVYDEDACDWTTFTTIQLAAMTARGEQPVIPTLGAPAEMVERVFEQAPAVAAADLARPRAYSSLLQFDCRSYEIGSVSQRVDFLKSVIKSLGRVRGDDNHIRVDVPAPIYQADFIDTIIATTRGLGGLAFREPHPRGKARLRLYLPDPLYLNLFGYDKKGKRNLNPRWQKFRPGVPERRIMSVRASGYDNVLCISVDAADQLYVTEDYLVTHNTIQGIGVGNNLSGLDSMLVVCPASAKEHWRREIEKWDVHGLSADIAHGDYFPDSQAVVINYDILDRHHDAIRAGTWGLAIFDEAHGLINEETKRTSYSLGGFKRIPNPKRPKGKKLKIRVEPIKARRRLFLTGTPIPNRPKNIWPITKACDPHGIGKDYLQFAYRYCGGYETGHGLDDTGSSNEDELHDILHERFMIRRLKKDVLKDLPPKTRQVIPVSSDGLNRKLAAERDAVMELLLAYEKAQGLSKDISTADLAEIILNARPQMFEDYARAADGDLNLDETPINKLAIARQDLALSKIPLIVEHVENLLENEEKVVVFGYHKLVMKGLFEAFQKYDPALITGATPVALKRDKWKTRQGQVDRFQEDQACRVMLGQFTAAGMIYTMTAARVVVCGELTWVPHELTQAEDRCHRLGQLCNVLVHHLVVTGSLDDALIARIIAKQDVIDRILDGKKPGACLGTFSPNSYGQFS